MPNEQIFGISSIIREECGNNAIEPGYVKGIEEDGKIFEKYFTEEEVTFTVSRKLEKPKKNAMSRLII